MLTALETTDSVNKCVWLKHLTTYFEVMGLATLHWIDRIIRMLLDNTVCIEPLRWLYVLKVCISKLLLRKFKLRTYSDGSQLSSSVPEFASSTPG